MPDRPPPNYMNNTITRITDDCPHDVVRAFLHLVRFVLLL